MGADGKIMARAARKMREEAEARHEGFLQRRREIYQALPRTEEIDRTLRTTAGRIVAETFHSGGDPGRAIAALREENLALQRERREILSAAGLPACALEEEPACPLCGDTLYVEGQPCRCLLERTTAEQNRELSRMLDIQGQSFDTFSFQWYDNAYWEAEGSSPRENMEIVYELCANYAHNFGSRSASLLMTGAPGLGKTFLSTCIAREVSAKGFSVVYDTAAHVFAQFERSKFGREDEAAEADVHRCMACDLLILDDLGSEMATAFVVSALYQIVNTRLMTGKKTILSTNLTPEEVGRRYGAAIRSRLEGEYQVLTFFGEDIRKLKRG